MKTKVKVKTIVQPMYKVSISSPARNGWFYCTADSDTAAVLQAKQTFPSYKIGECYECTDNWGICWSNN